MTKNVVQRLQTINQDLSSIISIYDLTSKAKKSDDELQKKQTTQKLPEMDTSECSESSTFCKQIRHLSFDTVKKRGQFVTRPSKSINSDERVSTLDGELQKGNKQKPGSAPTSYNTTHQSDYTWRQSLGLPRKAPDKNPPKGKPISGSCHTLWYNCKNCMDRQVVNTPSETIDIALENSMKRNNDETDHRTSKVHVQKTAYRFGAIEREIYKNFDKANADSAKSPANLKKDSEDGTLGGRPLSPALEAANEYGSDYGSTEIMSLVSSSSSKPLQHSPKKCGERLGRSHSRARKSAKSRTPSPTGKASRHSSKSKKDDDCMNDSKCSLKLAGRVNSRVRQAEKLFGDPSDERTNERGKKARGSQKIARDGEKNVEGLINERNAMLSGSIEKFERMRSSKDLALNIAKQLKDKCDVLRVSKDELIEKLKKVEKENRRLSTGLKAAEITEKKLQSKLEELKNESKNRLTEQENKIRKFEEETSKGKSHEREKQLIEEARKRESDQIPKERVHEIRAMMKVRENRTEDQRLSGDKRELQVKVEELREMLTKSNMKMEKLEEENRRLQYLQSISQTTYQIKTKVETPENPNELDSIRQNSRDLEEQVRSLRKSIEAFDEVQQKLVRQTKDYQKQMQSGLEEIEKLKSENTKLKTDLENEKDALLIKVKIIEDQQETIKQLKSKSEEVKTLVKKNQSLERILNIEREEKMELEEAVEHLNRRKEELKKKIKALENDLLVAPQEVVRDLQKTQVVLHELENQVQAKQKEWEFHLQSLIRQKEQACNVAEFATKKLMRTTCEFQRQTEAYKALQKIITDNISVKEKTPSDVSNFRGPQN